VGSDFEKAPLLDHKRNYEVAVGVCRKKMARFIKRPLVLVVVGVSYIKHTRLGHNRLSLRFPSGFLWWVFKFLNLFWRGALANPPT
jgi:hypothetical protein